MLQGFSFESQVWDAYSRVFGPNHQHQQEERAKSQWPANQIVLMLQAMSDVQLGLLATWLM
jgi:hypothetical protein